MYSLPVFIFNVLLINSKIHYNIFQSSRKPTNVLITDGLVIPRPIWEGIHSNVHTVMHCFMVFKDNPTPRSTHGKTNCGFISIRLYTQWFIDMTNMPVSISYGWQWYIELLMSAAKHAM